MKNILRSDAVANAKLYRVILSGFTAGTKLTAKINNKRITYAAASAEDAASGMATLINGSSYAEFQECIASSVGNELFLMARTAGRDFFVDFESQGSTESIIQVVRTTAGHELVNEVQKIKLSNGTTGGTWAYTNDFGTGPELTGNIDWGASGADVKAAIVALATPTVADLDVVRISDIEWDLYWKGAFAAVEVAEGTIDGVNLTGAGSAVLERTKIGRGPSNDVQRIQILPTFQTGTTEYSFRFAHGGNTTGELNEATSAAQLESALEGLPSIGAGNVKVYGGNANHGVEPNLFIGKHFFVVFQGALAGIEVSGITLFTSFKCSVSINTITQGGQATSNTIHVVDLGLPQAGVWSLDDGISSTGNLAGDVDAETVLAAIESLSTIDLVTVYGYFSTGETNVFAIEYKATHVNSAVPLLNLTTDNLASGSAPSISLVESGGANINETWELVINSTIGTFDLGDGTDTYLAIPFNESAANLEAGIEANLGEYPGVSVSGTGMPTIRS